MIIKLQYNQNQSYKDPSGVKEKSRSKGGQEEEEEGGKIEVGTTRPTQHHQLKSVQSGLE